MKNWLLAITLIFTSQMAIAQVGLGYGMTSSIDVYQNYKNPTSSDGASIGSALFNLGLGPKIWLGDKKFSFSVEAEAVVGLAAFSVKEYKGLGSLALPIMAKANFGGLTGFDNEGKMGFSIGGGMQYTRTELYYTTQTFKDNGGKREFFWLPVAQLGYGFGINGFTIHGFARVGYDHNTGARTLNFGIKNDFNIPKLKKIAKPESAL